MRQPDMTFSMTYPSCNTFLDPTPKVLLCFSVSDVKACHSLVVYLLIQFFWFIKPYFFSFDGEYYHSIESSKYSHQMACALGNYKGKALAVGCYTENADCSFATELLDMNTLKWSDGPDFPFAPQ